MLFLIAISALICDSLAYKFLAGNQFTFRNKYHSESRLRIKDGKWNSIGGHNGDYTRQELWILEENPEHPGCFYWHSERYPNWRLADSEGSLGAWKSKSDNQLWKMVPSGANDGYFYIYNCKYTGHRIENTKNKQSRVEIASGNSFNDAQLWRLIPRFNAKIYTDQLYLLDNRNGKLDPLTKSVTYGLIRSTSTSIPNLEKYKNAIKNSLHNALWVADVNLINTLGLLSQLNVALGRSNWKNTKRVSLTVPQGQQCKLMQHRVVIREQSGGEFSVILKGDTHMMCSESDAFVDDMDFVIRTD